MSQIVFRNRDKRDLSIKLEENTIFGLLGRNGAGKTTSLNMITGGIFPDSGRMKIGDSILKSGDIPVKSNT